MTNPEILSASKGVAEDSTAPEVVREAAPAPKLLSEDEAAAMAALEDKTPPKGPR
jgi:hypothetical protein